MSGTFAIQLLASKAGTIMRLFTVDEQLSRARNEGGLEVLLTRSWRWAPFLASNWLTRIEMGVGKVLPLNVG